MLKNNLVSFALGLLFSLIIFIYFKSNAVMIALLSSLLLCYIGVLLFKKQFLKVGLSLAGFGFGFLILSIFLVFHSASSQMGGVAVNAECEVTNYSIYNAEKNITTVPILIYSMDGKETNYKSQLSIIDKKLAYYPGDKLSVIAEVRLPEDNESFAGKRYAYSKGISFYLKTYDEPMSSLVEKIPLKYIPLYTAQKIRSTIFKYLDEKEGAFITALLLGDNLYLDEKFNNDIRSIGLSHVIAVSGMHLAYLSGFLLLFLGRRYSPVIILVIVFFSIMVGLPPSIVRAAIMQIILLVGILIQRDGSDTLNSLVVALILILSLNPYAITDVSLQLSFAATLGIILYSGKFFNILNDRTMKYVEKTNPLIKYTLTTVSTTSAALLFTIPITLFTFDTVSVVSFLSNLLLLYFIEILFLLSIGALGLSLLWSGFSFLLTTVIQYLAKFIIFVVASVAKIPFSSVGVGSIFILLFFAYLYCVILSTALMKKESKRFILTICSITMSLIFSLTLTATYAYSKDILTINTINVGQGQCVILQNNGRNFLIDCGGNLPGDEGQLVYKYMQRTNIKSLDFILVSHFHEDHAGGMNTLLQKMPPKMLILPDDYTKTNIEEEIIETAKAQNIEIKSIRKNLFADMGDLKIEIYPILTRLGINEQGLAALFKYKNFSIIIAGDMPSSLEEMIVLNNHIEDVDTIFVSHHGSNTSTSEKYLNIIKPTKAVISVGENSYGHPTEAVLARLESFGIKIYRTDLNGSIIMKEKGN